MQVIRRKKEYNCYICEDCGKVFDKPYQARVHDTVKKTNRLLFEYCPFCSSERIYPTYDEEYEEYIRGLQYDA